MTIADLQKVWVEYTALMPEREDIRESVSLSANWRRQRDALWREYCRIRDELFKIRRERSH